MADDWHNALCSQVCGGDCGTCMGSWFCSPCLFGRSWQRLEQFPNQNKEDFSNCSSGCWIFCGASCFHFGWLATLLKRMELRERFGIQGNGCTDCLVSYFCTPCTLAQMETELKDRAASAQGGRGTQDAGYVAPSDNMTYQPPSEKTAAHTNHSNQNLYQHQQVQQQQFAQQNSQQMQLQYAPPPQGH
ncbi:hypothetical protein AC579_1671 [Pseudocercospora musae]|uniref:PLAC8 family protein n=1 Tax=Pseudocercospora musae TaxID=113226 RepID=A0A139I962_9PEZI|nr:hypothetical protein AC579_1671 [Pseudocercospora musae]KXT11291.1 hypothetical protein AC579_1671 [Pseudocercospora musae]